MFWDDEELKDRMDYETDSPSAASCCSQALCECGCGQPTTINKHDNRKEGTFAGQPRRFVQGHWHRWMRKNGRPNWGQRGRELCMRIATRIAQEISESRWDEAIGPAFEACIEYLQRRGSYRPALEQVAREAIAKHFKSQKLYGHVSVDCLTEKGYEIES